MLYPLKFKPIIKTLVWGVERWLLSAYEGDESVVSEGSDAGKSLPELIREYKGALVGKSVYQSFGERFPLLIKDIVSHDQLSIQVHPDDALARKRGLGNGKTEMWYIHAAEPGAFLMSGFSHWVTPEQYQELVEEHRITEVLAHHPVAPGDVFFIPAGRIHSIGAGVSLYEIQQTSDTTYRIYDFGRLGLDGAPRKLHTAEALEAIDFSVYDNYRAALPLQCPYFTTDRLDVTEKRRLDLRETDSFLAVIGLEGKVVLETSILHGWATKGHRTELSEGEIVLIPAASSWLSVTPEGPEASVLTTHV